MEFGNYSANVTDFQGAVTAQEQLEYCRGIVEADIYGTAMEQASRDFTNIIIALFLSNLILVFTGRMLLRDEPLKIEALGYKIEKELQVSEKTIKRLDTIAFTIQFTLVSFLFVLQFVPYGQFI